MAIDQVALKDLLDHPGSGSVTTINFVQRANAFLKCAVPKRLQELADSLTARDLPPPGSPVNGILGAWAVLIDDNAHAWVVQFVTNEGIIELRGARTETCPPGTKTGDAISPPGGYKGGGILKRHIRETKMAIPSSDQVKSRDWILLLGAGAACPSMGPL
jgi:hypothetical protein